MFKFVKEKYFGIVTIIQYINKKIILISIFKKKVLKGIEEIISIKNQELFDFYFSTGFPGYTNGCSCLPVLLSQLDFMCNHRMKALVAYMKKYTLS